mgnify:CR=1 FL=1
MLMLFLTVAMVHIVALMSPGPDFFFVSQTAVSRSRKEAMIHGEPGVDEKPLGTSDDVAKTLVDGLLDDRPENPGNRVIAIVNGLGDTKYEELFVLYRDIAKRLRDAGLEIVEGEVGEFVTSLDMAGASLTLVWLDDEIEKYWFAPCDTPAYRKGNMQRPEADTTELASAPEPVTVTEKGSEESQALAAKVVETLKAISDLMHEKEEELGRIDSVAGDGDHGIGMARGSKAAVEQAEELAKDGGGAATVLAGAGDAWSASAGGTSGALWGALITAFGSALGDEEKATKQTLIEASRAALDAVTRRGGAEVGDKTMVDAFVPAVEALEAGKGWDEAIAAAKEGAEKTKDLVAKVGRARPLGEKSLGTPDAGATSLAMIIETVVKNAQ